MKVGDKIYHVTSNGNIETFIITEIDGVDITVCWIEDNTFHVSFTTGEDGTLPINIHTSYENAQLRAKSVKAILEQRRQSYFEEILKQALNSPTLIHIERDGVLLKEVWKDNLQGLLYEYDNKKYIVVYQYDDAHRKQCIKFEKKY